MRVIVMTADEQIISLQVDAHESVEEAKALLEVEVASGTTEKKNHVPAGGQSFGTAGGGMLQGPDFEAKIAKLVERGFGRDAVIEALKFFDGNEQEAASFLGAEYFPIARSLSE